MKKTVLIVLGLAIGIAILFQLVPDAGLKIKSAIIPTDSNKDSGKRPEYSRTKVVDPIRIQ